MKKLFAVVCLAVGVMACGPATDGAEESLGSTEQAVCAPLCPPDYWVEGTVWGCTGQTSSSCPGGYEEEFYYCTNGSGGSYESGGPTCRRRCGCAIEVD